MIIYLFAVTCSFFLSMGTIIGPSISLSFLCDSHNIFACHFAC